MRTNRRVHEARFPEVVEAAKRRQRVAFIRAADLVRELIEARDDRQLGRLKRRYLRVDLLICDELGFVPFDKTGGELLFNLLADRYKRRLLPNQQTTNQTENNGEKVSRCLDDHLKSGHC